jgi:hypothetical protein
LEQVGKSIGLLAERHDGLEPRVERQRLVARAQIEHAARC